MKTWHLLYTKPRQERIALEHLERQDYEVYLPTISVERLRTGRRTHDAEPLFSRYLFVRLDPEGSQSWSPIRSTIGVSGLVRFGARFATVTSEMIEWLKDQTACKPMNPSLQSGDVVQVIRHPFLSGLEGIFKSFDGEHRALLFLNIVSKDTLVSLDLRQIQTTH